MSKEIVLGSSMVCVRYTKLRTVRQLGLMEAHGKRAMGGLAHVDLSRTELNRFYLGRVSNGWGIAPCNLGLLWEKFKHEEQLTLPKGRAVASHVILSADPERLIVADTLEAWIERSLEWAEMTWPRQVIAARLDLDESSPHLDVFLVPNEMQGDKYGNQFRAISPACGSRGKALCFSALQTSYALHLAPLGFKRGTPKSDTQASNIPVRKYRADLYFEVMRATQLRLELEADLERERLRLAELENWAASLDQKESAIKEQTLAQRQLTLELQRREIASAALAAQLQQEMLRAKAVQAAANDFQNRLLLREQSVKESELAISEAEEYIDRIECEVENLRDKAHTEEKKTTTILEALILFEHMLKDNQMWYLETLDDDIFHFGIQQEVADMMNDAHPELLRALAEAQQQLTQLSTQQRLHFAQMFHSVVAILTDGFTTANDQAVARRVALT
jgi:hypothetical protein